MVRGFGCIVLAKHPGSPVDAKVVVSDGALLSWDVGAVGDDAAWLARVSMVRSACVGPSNAGATHMVSGTAFAWKVDVKWKGKALRLCFFSS